MANWLVSMLGCAPVSITLIGYFCGNEQQVALRGTVRGDMKAEQVGVPASGGKKNPGSKINFLCFTIL